MCLNVFAHLFNCFLPSLCRVLFLRLMARTRHLELCQFASMSLLAAVSVLVSVSIISHALVCDVTLQEPVRSGVGRRCASRCFTPGRVPAARDKHKQERREAFFEVSHSLADTAGWGSDHLRMALVKPAAALQSTAVGSVAPRLHTDRAVYDC